jgi:hypothetical protein
LAAEELPQLITWPQSSSAAAPFSFTLLWVPSIGSQTSSSDSHHHTSDDTRRSASRPVVPLLGVPDSLQTVGPLPANAVRNPGVVPRSHGDGVVADCFATTGLRRPGVGVPVCGSDSMPRESRKFGVLQFSVQPVSEGGPVSPPPGGRREGRIRERLTEPVPLPRASHQPRAPLLFRGHDDRDPGRSPGCWPPSWARTSGTLRLRP